jgi:hypothetical protein
VIFSGCMDGRRWAGGVEDKWVVVVVNGKCSGVSINEGGCQH